MAHGWFFDIQDVQDRPGPLPSKRWVAETGSMFRKAAEQGDLSKLSAMASSEQKRLASGGGSFRTATPLALRPDKYRRTAIFYAAWGGHVECVKLLMPISNILQHDFYGYTPLMAAARAPVNAQECFDLLLPFSHANARSKKSNKTARKILEGCLGKLAYQMRGAHG